MRTYVLLGYAAAAIYCVVVAYAVTYRPFMPATAHIHMGQSR